VKNRVADPDADPGVKMDYNFGKYNSTFVKKILMEKKN
jgi:hypothetical protein